MYDVRCLQRQVPVQHLMQQQLSAFYIPRYNKPRITVGSKYTFFLRGGGGGGRGIEAFKERKERRDAIMMRS